ncbi:UNVERIFIED_CONTAM: hypothetical protein HDU68_001335, partial [Siphonaria sp. JEL0065]
MYNQPPFHNPYGAMHHMPPPGFPPAMPPGFAAQNHHLNLNLNLSNNPNPAQATGNTIEKPPIANQNPTPTLDKLTTAFVGNIADGIEDKWLEALFKNCGDVKSWNRVVNTSGAPLSFGFITFESAQSLHTLLHAVARERRAAPGGPLVPNPIPLKGKKLVVKIDVSARKASMDLIAGLVAEGGVGKVEELEKDVLGKVEAYLKETGFYEKEAETPEATALSTLSGAEAKKKGEGEGEDDADRFLNSIGVSDSTRGVKR